MNTKETNDWNEYKKVHNITNKVKLAATKKLA